MGDDLPKWKEELLDPGERATAKGELLGNRNQFSVNDGDTFVWLGDVPSSDPTYFMEEVSCAIRTTAFTQDLELRTVVRDETDTEIFWRVSNPPNMIHTFSPALPTPPGGQFRVVVKNFSGGPVDIEATAVFRVG